MKNLTTISILTLLAAGDLGLVLTNSYLREQNNVIAKSAAMRLGDPIVVIQLGGLSMTNGLGPTVPNTQMIITNLDGGYYHGPTDLQPEPTADPGSATLNYRDPHKS
ncbi:MAG TPA: hypothetical protein VH413_16160 [Verrucomicrobiae bacterium]|jgi:hypothetical protein|nr:hypothetical protein [Verrucomicrobiae bacterium]